MGRLIVGARPRGLPPNVRDSENYANVIIEFVKAHEEWAPLVVFLLAFGELLAFISLLLPAWAALLGIGALIMAGGINFWPIWIAASLGAASATGCPTGSAASSNTRCSTSGRCHGTRT